MERLEIYALIIIGLISKTNSENNNFSLPIFHIDNYEQCINEKKLFCSVKIVLNSHENTTIWKQIQESRHNPNLYRRDELFHSICVDNFCNISHTEDIQQQIAWCYQKKYENFSLSSQIEWVKCDQNSRFSFNQFDIFVVIILIIFVLVPVVFQSESHPILKAFHTRNNFRKIKNYFFDKDSKQIKLIEGIRFYTMCFIILAHTGISYGGAYLSNPEYFEQYPDNFLRNFLKILGGYIVQPFFLLSGFLLSTSLLKIMDKRAFDLRIIFNTFLNRFLRLLPPVLVMVSFFSSPNFIRLSKFFGGPITSVYFDKEHEACQKNFWTNLLFLSNHINYEKMCYISLWYVSADFQLYTISLIILSAIWLKRSWTKTFLISAIVLGILTQMTVVAFNDMQYVLRITPEEAKLCNLRSWNFHAAYSATYTNFSSYLIGLSMGFVHHRQKKIDFLTKTWTLFFFGLPLMVVLITMQNYDKWLEIFLGGVLKPCYAFGVMLGILGLMQKNDSLIRKVLEWKLPGFLAQFNYSTYVVHIIVVFYRTYSARQTLFVSDWTIFTSFILDLIISYFAGFVLYLLVEMPMDQLRKLWIPQVRSAIKYNIK